MRKSAKIFLFMVIVISIFALASCGKVDVKFNEEQEKADKVVKDVKWDMYFHEEAEEIKAIVRRAKEKIREAGKNVDMGKIKKAIKEFKDEVRKVPTKSAYIETYTNAIKKNFASLKDENKVKAENILKSFEDRMRKSKTKKELDILVKEIEEKVKAETGEEVEKVDTAAIKAGAMRVGSRSTDETGVNSNSAKSSASSAKDSSMQTKSTTKPDGKKRVWVVDKAAWTETKTYPNYATREIWWIRVNGVDTTYYNKDEWRAALKDLNSKGIGSSCGNSTENYIKDYYTETIEHPEEGHWEYR